MLIMQKRANEKNHAVLKLLRACWERGEYTVFICGGFVLLTDKPA